MSVKTTFQHLECVNPKRTDLIAVIGRQADGKSVCVKIPNVQPHLCIRNELNMKVETFQAELNRKIHEYTISNQLLRQEKNKECGSMPNFFNRMREDVKYNHALVEEFKAQDIMNYNEEGTVSFFKISVKSKRYFYDVKKILKNVKSRIITHQTNLKKEKLTNINVRHFRKGSVKNIIQFKSVGVRDHQFTLYNEQVDFMLQYFIDNDIFSCGWLHAEGEEDVDKMTTCDIEITAKSIKQVESQGMAPWRIFSYDIESLPAPHPNREGKFTFPVAEKDPVVTIGGVLQNGKRHKFKQYVWILRPFGDPVNKFPAFTEKQDCDYQPEGTVVFDFDNEANMLHHFFYWCTARDIDIIQGHNVNRFDNTYMLDRYHKIFQENPVWGRFLAEESSVKITTFNSNQKGSNQQYKLHLPGRVVMDSYDIMKDQHNEGSYRLGDLAQSYLGTDKMPMDYDMIYPKYHTLEGRLDLAIYCVKDAWLVYKLMDKLCKLTVISQMANVTGISMKDVMNRGQGIRTISLMLRYAKRRKPQLMLPRMEKKVFTTRVRKFVNTDDTLTMTDVEVESDKKFQGAVVVDPDAGFYTDAVSCLDFASLYPSIMVCMNMSYETLVHRATINHMKWVEDTDVRTIPDYDLVDGKLVTTVNPKNPSFVMKEKRLGILPEILWDLWQERKRVKKQMKKEVPHSTMYNVKDGTQLALKVCMNSIYGFTAGYMLQCKEIASSVTKYGRGLILKTKSLIENHPEWGRDGHGCKCVYGDTDSVFVHMPRTLVDGKTNEETVEKAHEMGEIMANYVTKFFLDPVFLEYEKTYLPFLLLKKKRYVGMKNEPGLPRKLHIKGLESVRRDYAPLLVDTQKKVLNAIVKEQDVSKACAIIKDVVKRLKMNQIPIDMLIMSKKLSRPVEQYKAKAPHVQLTKRLMKENPDKAPVSGDRVPFVIYTGTGGTSDRACTPEEITAGKYMVDRDYYLEKQLMKPLLRIMDRVISDPNTLFQCRSIFVEGPKSGSMFASWGKQKREKRKAMVPSTDDVKKKKKKKSMSIKSFFT